MIWISWQIEATDAAWWFQTQGVSYASALVAAAMVRMV